MNRVHTMAFRLLVALPSFVLVFCRQDAGANAFVSGANEASKRKPDQKKAEENPFAPEPAPPLPAGMTGSDANDPRAKLAPGMYDAGETSMGLKHLMLLKKPDAFQLDSAILMIRRCRRPWICSALPTPQRCPSRSSWLWLNWLLRTRTLRSRAITCFMGNFYGVNIYDISNPAKTQLLTSMVCPGGQGDVSVYKNLMFMSVEMPNGRLDCGTQGFPPAPPPTSRTKTKKPPAPAPQKDRFRGVRIFDISDIKSPKQVAAVQTCRGSHTHTLVVDPNDKNNVYIYVSGTSFVRQSEELAGCSGDSAGQGSEYVAVSH